MKYPAGVRFTLFIFSVFHSFASFSQTISQTNFAEKVSSWKTQFPKQDVIAYSNKVKISFELNTSAAENEPKVKAHVLNEVELVPVKDFIKFEDGLFYTDETSIDNVKAVNATGKDVPVEKQCMSYSEENIFHSDTKLCVVKFPPDFVTGTPIFC